MLLHNSSFFRIYFGNAQDQLYPADYARYKSEPSLLTQDPFVKFKKILGIEKLVFMEQFHSGTGHIITTENVPSLIPFKQKGDFLVTQERQIGVGIITADCLPIIFYDRFNKLVAIAHAGWRGSVAQISVNTIKTMQKYFNTDLDHLKIFFGPCAKACCYTIRSDVSQIIEEKFVFADHVLHPHGDDQFFCDILALNKLQLEAVGVKREAFRFEYALCTMCDSNFFSSRRQGIQAGRQMTIVALK